MNGELIKTIDEPFRDSDTGKMWINISISNDAIRYIKSAVMFYEGDMDDPNNEQKKIAIRNAIHSLWKLMNPS